MAPSSGTATKLNAGAQLQTFHYPTYSKIVYEFKWFSDVAFTNFAIQKRDGQTKNKTQTSNFFVLRRHTKSDTSE